MKTVAALCVILLLFVSCSKEPVEHRASYGDKYRGQIIYDSPHYQDTTVSLRTFLGDSILWWEAPRVIVAYQEQDGRYAVVDAIIKSTPSCLDTCIFIHSGTGRIEGDSLFEQGVVHIIQWNHGKRATESGTWRASLKKQP